MVVWRYFRGGPADGLVMPMHPTRDQADVRADVTQYPMIAPESERPLRHCIRYVLRGEVMVEARI